MITGISQGFASFSELLMKTVRLKHDTMMRFRGAKVAKMSKSSCVMIGGVLYPRLSLPEDLRDMNDDEGGNEDYSDYEDEQDSKHNSARIVRKNDILGRDDKLPCHKVCVLFSRLSSSNMVNTGLETTLNPPRMHLMESEGSMRMPS